MSFHPFYRGGSASKKNGLPAPSHHSEAARCASTGIVPATPPPFSVSCYGINYGVGFGEDEEVERVRSASCSASFFLMSCNSFRTSSRSVSR